MRWRASWGVEVAEDGDFALGGLEEAGEDAEEGGFAGAVFAEQDVAAAGGEVDGDLAQGGEGAEEAGDLGKTGERASGREFAGGVWLSADAGAESGMRDSIFDDAGAGFSRVRRPFWELREQMALIFGQMGAIAVESRGVLRQVDASSPESSFSCERAILARLQGIGSRQNLRWKRKRK
jgi:hypothetical protein